MQLIVDSGSTKTLWCLVESGICIQEVQTLGINPYINSKADIINLIKEQLMPQLNSIPTEIFYYGAGCSSESNVELVKDSLIQINSEAKIEVHHDLLAVARALCQNEPGIAVILGTGSNSCLYDGNKILMNTPSLGYVLGDEGSGAHIGKLFLSDLWYNLVPENLKTDFFAEHPNDLEYYLMKVYKQAAANAFLASFTKFLIKHKTNEYVKNLIKQSFLSFVEKHIVPYGMQLSNRINCIGSIAFYFMDEWKEVILQKGYVLGSVEQVPIHGLIKFHS
jgi:glucosamine kinase